MKSDRSLQKRLGISLTVGATLLWLLGVTASGLVAQHEMDEVFDSALEETAQRILPLAVTDILNRETDTGSQTAPALKEHDEYLTYVVRDRQGQLLLQSHDADLSVFQGPPREGFHTTGSHRIYGASAISDTLFIEIAEPLAHRREAAMEAGVALLVPLLFLVPVSLLGIWWIVRLSLRPVARFQHSIEARGVSDLSPVDTDGLPTEFQPTAIAVNRLLKRLNRALDAERSFTANSAHELRTPLATALAKVQRLKKQLEGHHLFEDTVQIENALRGLSTLSEKLLELAKAEGGAALSEHPQDLVPILAMVARDFEFRAPGRLRLSLPGLPVTSLLDPDAFAILVRNLIENALKYGATHHPIEVTLNDDGRLRVCNAGEVVPPERLARLRNRFTRYHTRPSGSGLGLAIAEAIASGSGMPLAIRSPATGQADGFEVEVNIAHAGRNSEPCT
ncbi:two-component sensor histidine kinase [Marinobacter fuscus]|uniref:histidine kinase n=1 Tax=Marinobacter fuscus TaxID=2109942 RepID=A0A2T1K3Q1_9GAMM|nr:ATP-binding protein [Marinobacter fuscus]PSF04700.1 two-component sensor histidine kinase [Marinobacter fuscus]